MAEEKENFIKEQLGGRKASELTTPERVEVVQAFNRKFYSDLNTTYRGCARGQLSEVYKLLGLDAPKADPKPQHIKATARKAK